MAAEGCIWEKSPEIGKTKIFFKYFWRRRKIMQFIISHFCSVTWRTVYIYLHRPSDGRTVVGSFRFGKTNMKYEAADGNEKSIRIFQWVITCVTCNQYIGWRWNFCRRKLTHSHSQIRAYQKIIIYTTSSPVNLFHFAIKKCIKFHIYFI